MKPGIIQKAIWLKITIQKLKSTQIQLKEEDRVAAIVAAIDEDAAIVPRAAFIKTPLGEVHTNRSFEGLEYISIFHTPLISSSLEES